MAKKPLPEKPVVIGWREKVRLPSWGLRLNAKVDTGARSSSIDVSELEDLEDGRVRFKVRLSRRRDSVREVEARVHRRTRVKSSNGQVQERVVVRTTLELAGVRKKILVTLTCRKKMLHRMLLGREALADDFLISAGVDHLTRDVATDEPPKTVKKPSAPRRSSVR